MTDEKILKSCAYSIAIPKPDGYNLRGYHWTTEPPTVKGWYWAKTKVDSMQCVEVIHQSDNKQIFVFITDVEGSVDLGYFTNWLGPLPVPAVPEKDKE